MEVQKNKPEEHCGKWSGRRVEMLVTDGPDLINWIGETF